MDKLHSAAPSKGGFAKKKLRPMAHGQFRLLPVPVRGAREWNACIARWAA